MRRRRPTSIASEVPLAADLVALGLGSGATPVEAVALAAAWAPTRVASHFDAVLRRLDHGASLAQALGAAADAEPSLALLLRALLAAHHGAPVAAAVDRLAADTRAELRRRADEYARTVPTRLLFPLIVLVLPAFALLSVVPALIAGLGSL